MSALAIVNISLGLLASATGQGEEIEVTEIGKQEVKLSLRMR